MKLCLTEIGATVAFLTITANPMLIHELFDFVDSLDTLSSMSTVKAWRITGGNTTKATLTVGKTLSELDNCLECFATVGFLLERYTEFLDSPDSTCVRTM